MLYPICTTCGALLCNIQIPYEDGMKKICEKYNIDSELLSRGIIDNDGFNREKRELVDKLTSPHRYCCKMRLINYTHVVEIIAK